MTAARPCSADGVLRDRLVAGEESALAEVYDRYAPLAHGVALRVTGNWSAAQDVTQEVFVQVWEHPARFDPERGDLRSWIGLLAHRRAVDWVRREVAHRRAADRHGMDRAAAGPEPADLVVNASVGLLVRLAVESLPPPQREAVRLAYFQGHSYRQVAAVLGIPEGTAKSRLRLGLAGLAKRLEAEGLSVEGMRWNH